MEGVLIVGGTGTVGREVVRGLLGSRLRVQVLTRESEKVNRLPEGVEGAIGDLQDPTTLPIAMKGINRMFLVTPMSRNEAALGIAAVGAAKEVGIKHIVYMSVFHAESVPQVPHFKSKTEVEQAILESGVAYTFLRPNNFFQNDLWNKDAILERGVYPHPIGEIGMNRVDARDIAEAAVRALTLRGYEGRAYSLVGPDSLTGPQVAALYSRYLGRHVEYRGNDLETWARQAKESMPQWLVDDLKTMYEYIQTHGQLATKEDLQDVQKALGHGPRTFETFVRETIASWSPRYA